MSDSFTSTGVPAGGVPTAVVFMRAENGRRLNKHSIEHQREACNWTATCLRAFVLNEFVEEGNTTQSTCRPELEKTLRVVQDQKPTYLIVFRRDLLTRSAETDVQMQQALYEAGTQLISVTEPPEASSEADLVECLLNTIADHYGQAAGRTTRPK